MKETQSKVVRPLKRRRKASSHEMQQCPGEAGNDTQLTASKKAGHSVIDLKELKSVNQACQHVDFGLMRPVQDL